MITFENIIVNYGDFKALDLQTKIEIGPNDRVGIIGSNGSGKTTLIKACLGLLPYTGSITSDASVNEMAVHLQANDYVDTMNCKSIMETVLQCQISKSQELKELIDFFDFNASLKKKYKQLSGGQKQRFTLILVLMQNAPLTFFDEVTTGLDFETRMSLMDKLSTWYQDKGAAIVFVTHYFEELSRLTNKLLIIDKGQFIDYGDRDELFRKYCGHAVIIFDDNESNQRIASAFTTCKAPNGRLAVVCENQESELQVLLQLNEASANYVRSDSDVELLYLNALEAYYEALS